MSESASVELLEKQLQAAEERVAKLEQQVLGLEGRNADLRGEIKEYEQEAATDKREIIELTEQVIMLEARGDHHPGDVAHAVHDYLCQRGLAPPAEDLPWKATSGEWHHGLYRAVATVLDE